MGSEHRPLVSIIVPSFNQGSFIEDTLQSILKQDYRRIEILVMDGGSSDETLSVLERYRGQIAYVSEPDNGQSHAINKGFRKAKGDVIAWLNSDDIYPDRAAVRRMVEEFGRQAQVDLIYGDFIEIDAHRRIVKYHRRPRFSLRRLLRVGYISQPATFFRRRVVEAMDLREDLHYGMDLEYWLRADRLGFQIGHLPFLVAAERLHDDAKCVRDSDKMAAEALALREAHGARVTPAYRILRLLDHLWLYLVRLPAISDLMTYKREAHRLTMPLDFDRAIRRTLLLGVRSAD